MHHHKREPKNTNSKFLMIHMVLPLAASKSPFSECLDLNSLCNHVKGQGSWDSIEIDNQFMPKETGGISHCGGVEYFSLMLDLFLRNCHFIHPCYILPFFVSLKSFSLFILMEKHMVSKGQDLFKIGEKCQRLYFGYISHVNLKDYHCNKL